MDESAPIDAVPRWFQGVEMNFAENLLFPASQAPKTKQAGDIALTEIREGARPSQPPTHVTWGEFRSRVGRAAAAMRERGVRRGDRVVAVGSNSVATLVVWLAAAWVGAVFSSSSTDMGVEGILQRTRQVDPKVGLSFLSFLPIPSFSLAWRGRCWVKSTAKIPATAALL